ncbi:restriction methylase [Escherichia coli O145:H28]|nr:restriction methylase [Escherichia coli]GEF30169.1 restriction methylase [Escherichia coli O145:H28]
MSDITISRPEVVNGHTDVICSTSIRHILAVRKSTLFEPPRESWRLNFLRKR